MPQNNPGDVDYYIALTPSALDPVQQCIAVPTKKRANFADLHTLT